jgi:putative hydrolase of the HAD superfamily
VRAVTAQAGIAATDAEVADAAARLEATGGQPGGSSSFAVPPHVAQSWARRDLSPQDHRAAYTALIEEARLPWPGLAGVLYDRQTSPEAWQPYPDTAAALDSLADRGIPAAVLSNTGFDVRPVFRAHGVDDLVSAYVLSFEQGIIKPDPRIFRVACDLLGAAPADTVMVGDDAAADGAATAIGCAFRQVPHLPPARRPHALLDVVNSVRIA